MNTDQIIQIDGSQGEGGGQVLRSALSLSLVTGRPFEITNIRAGRSRPGLLRQHLTAVEAAVQIGGACVEGAVPGSRQLRFAPGAAVRPGRYTFSVGTAGSAVLVLQTVLPALLTASAPSTLVLEGGTHNPAAPPFEFLDRVFLPVLRRMGVSVAARLERRGFYPAGGGRFTVEVEPAGSLAPIQLFERGEIVGRRLRAVVENLPRHIARRELDEVCAGLAFEPEQAEIEEVQDGRGPGNVLLVELESTGITEVFTGFGEHQRSAEAVARDVVSEARQYLAAGVPVGRRLADQLLLPMALAGGGTFRTLPLSRHAQTNIEVIRTFLDVDIRVAREGRVCVVAVE